MKRYLVLSIAGLIGTLTLFGQKRNIPKAGCSTVLSEAMFAKKDTVKDRGVADNYHTWENGVTLRVKFMPGGGKMIREKVMQNAREWEMHGNVKLQFVPDNEPVTDIRIKLGQGLGHNSAVGTEAKFRSQNEQTMNFDTISFADFRHYLGKLQKKGNYGPYTTRDVEKEMKTDPDRWDLKELRRVVMHEFGHALGLLHEQSFPGAIKWNRSDSAYQYYLETQGWNRAKVDFNVFEVAEQFYTNGTAYDPKSIMHYSVEPWQTTDGFSLKDNYELSYGDKGLIAALYPKDRKESVNLVPKITISNFTKLTVTANTTRKGLVIQPSFDLKTNAKLGEVYFVARLFTTDDKYISTSGLFYNWAGSVGTYKKVNLLPNTKISYNKLKKNFELFLPFDYIPALNGEQVGVEFTVYLNDVANSQMNKLMYFSSSAPMSIPQR